MWEQLVIAINVYAVEFETCNVTQKQNKKKNSNERSKQKHWREKALALIVTHNFNGVHARARTWTKAESTLALTQFFWKFLFILIRFKASTDSHTTPTLSAELKFFTSFSHDAARKCLAQWLFT